MFYMLEDQRLEPTATTHEKKGKLSSIHLQGITFYAQGDMFKILLWVGKKMVPTV